MSLATWIKVTSFLVADGLVAFTVAGAVLGFLYGVHGVQTSPQDMVLESFVYNTHDFDLVRASLEYEVKDGHEVIAGGVVPLGRIPAKDYITLNHSIRFSRPVDVKACPRVSGRIVAYGRLIRIPEEISDMAVESLGGCKTSVAAEASR